jgi:dTDP-4-amino-4,6-dideoxygalactose transaminase
MPHIIPFNRPSMAGKELEYMQQAIANMHISGDGAFTRKCQTLLQQELGVTKVLLTTSCTDALEMTALLLKIQPGDEVIVPSFTFVSTINAFVLRGARPIFADIRPDTLNIDEKQLEHLITPRTKAIVIMHYAGVACEMDEILKVAARYSLSVIEDNAHGMFGKYKGKNLGTFGCLATQSFHETKNFTCGEGGALLINDPCYIEQAEIIREKGTDRNRFIRGQVDKYTWVDIGSSFLLSDILAAFLFAQLEAQAQIQAKRRLIWENYFFSLKDWGMENDVRLPTVPEHCEHPYHIFYLLMPSLKQRQTMIEHLKRHAVNAVFHYLPLHISKMGLRFGFKLGDCPVTEDISNRLLRLPIYNDLTTQEQAWVITCIREFKANSSS